MALRMLWNIRIRLGLSQQSCDLHQTPPHPPTFAPPFAHLRCPPPLAGLVAMGHSARSFAADLGEAVMALLRQRALCEQLQLFVGRL